MRQDAEPLAIVLAAGKGTRMNSDLPKVLCCAAGRPLIQYVLDALSAAGIQQIIVVAGYRSELVRRELAGRGVKFVEQEKQLGTGHAVMVCREQLAGHNGPVVIVAGDSPMLQASSLRRLLQRFEQQSAAGILGSLVTDQPTGLGRIIRDHHGRLQAIVEEKDATAQQRGVKEVNMSMYVFQCRALLEALAELSADNHQGEFYITDVPEILLARGYQVDALPVLQPCEALSVNTPEELQRVERELERRNNPSCKS